MNYFDHSINDDIYSIKKLDGNKLVMKSIEIKEKGWLEIGNSCKNPYDTNKWYKKVQSF